MRGLRDPSEQSLEPLRENRMERDAGGIDGEEGGWQVFMVVKEKRRGRPHD
jgi:hypothetical protein